MFPADLLMFVPTWATLSQLAHLLHVEQLCRLVAEEGQAECLCVENQEGAKER